MAGLKLLLAFDDHFTNYAAIAILSFVIHRAVDEVIIATDEKVDNKFFYELCIQFSVKVRHIRLDLSKTTAIGSREVAYFYCIDAIEQVCTIFNDCNVRILYVDADTMCVRNLDELTTLNANGKGIWVCSHGRPMYDRALVLGLKDEYSYFNAGVILFDPKQLRGRLTYSYIEEEYIANIALTRFREQCILNKVLRNAVDFLPNQYNYLSWMRLRNKDSAWHNEKCNLMAYCLSDVREKLGIVHFSAGSYPDRVSEGRLELIDRYWLYLKSAIENRRTFNCLKQFREFSMRQSS